MAVFTAIVGVGIAEAYFERAAQAEGDNKRGGNPGCRNASIFHRLQQFHVD